MCTSFVAHIFAKKISRLRQAKTKLFFFTFCVYLLVECISKKMHIYIHFQTITGHRSRAHIARGAYTQGHISSSCRADICLFYLCNLSSDCFHLTIVLFLTDLAEMVFAQYFISGKQMHYQSVVSTSHWPLQYPRFRPYLPFSSLLLLLRFNSRGGSNYKKIRWKLHQLSSSP